MIRLAPLALLWLAVLLAPARAAPFAIKLHAEAAKESRDVEASVPGPDGKLPVRAILTMKAGTPVTVKWTVRNPDAAATVKDVLVHFFVVKEDKPNQQEVPPLTKNVATESALTMDFRPKDRTEGELTFTLAAPGSYLLRLELKGAAGKNEREPFAALDLVAR